MFASSAFVPTQTMPGWLQTFADHQPVTQTANAIRALTQGGAVAGPLTRSLLWIVAIIAVFAPLAVARYRQGLSRLRPRAARLRSWAPGVAGSMRKRAARGDGRVGPRHVLDAAVLGLPAGRRDHAAHPASLCVPSA